VWRFITGAGATATMERAFEKALGEGDVMAKIPDVRTRVSDLRSLTAGECLGPLAREEKVITLAARRVKWWPLPKREGQPRNPLGPGRHCRGR